MTTTNGTRALQSCAHATRLLAGSFLNLQATADRVLKEQPSSLLIVCSGTFNQASYEDILAAGALCDLVWDRYAEGEISDTALISRRLYDLARADLMAAASHRGTDDVARNPDLKRMFRFVCNTSALVNRTTTG
jgi:2-phosphosulfolactate phosphatase